MSNQDLMDGLVWFAGLPWYERGALGFLFVCMVRGVVDFVLGFWK